jgi:hypothetical protein
MQQQQSDKAATQNSLQLVCQARAALQQLMQQLLLAVVFVT